MGRADVRHELESTIFFCSNIDVWQVFVNAGWDTYFERLQGFDEIIKVEFALNLEEDHSRVWGLNIPVTEIAISVISGLPHEGQKWFSRKAPLPEFQEVFLQDGETTIKKGRGYDHQSLPYPRGKVAYFMLRYITCEGHFVVMFKYHFKFLASLRFRHAQIHSLNMPFFLWKSLQLMAKFAHHSWQVLVALTNHGLVQLLVIQTLARTPIPWPQFAEFSEEELKRIRPTEGEDSEGSTEREDAIADDVPQEPILPVDSIEMEDTTTDAAPQEPTSPVVSVEMEDTTADVAPQEPALPVGSVEMEDVTADAGPQEPASHGCLVEVESMEIEDMVDAASTSVDNSLGEIPPPPLEQMSLMSEDESVGGVVTQEIAPPVQENLGFEVETISGVVTQEPTPLIEEALELVK